MANRKNKQIIVRVTEEERELIELTPTIVNEFIKKIIVHAPDKSSGHRVQKIQIIFNFIGKFTPQKEFIPDKKEIPQDYF